MKKPISLKTAKVNCITVAVLFLSAFLFACAFSSNAQIIYPRQAFVSGVIGHPSIGKPGQKPQSVMVADLPAGVAKKECWFFGGDSLNGFDFDAAAKQAELEGDKMYSEFKSFMFNAESEYVKKKFGIQGLAFEKLMDSKKITPPVVITAACNNLDFESGSFAGWVTSRGVNSNSNGAFTVMASPANLSTDQDIYSCNDINLITTAYGNDPIGFPGLDPLPNGGNYSARVGGFNINTAAGEGMGCDGYKYNFGGNSNGEQLSQTFAVTAANCLISFDYAVVLNDGGHPNGQQPYFHVVVTNGAGAVLTPTTCNEYYVQAAAGGPPAGFINSG
ncbi:MAG TPA: hypothetical protein VII99_14150, partial [Bacteroidia bacterium]